MADQRCAVMEDALRNDRAESIPTADVVPEQLTSSTDDDWVNVSSSEFDASQSVDDSDGLDDNRATLEHLKTIDDELNGTESKKSELEAEIADLTNKITVLEQKLKVSSIRFDAEVSKNIRERANLIAEHVEEISVWSDTFTEETVRLTDALCNERKKNVQLGETAATLRRNSGRLGNIIGTLREEKLELENKIDAWRTKYNTQTGRLGNKIGALRIEKAELIEQHEEKINELRDKYNAQTGHLGSIIGGLRKCAAASIVTDYSSSSDDDSY